jgi:hypothetical protein
MSTVMVTVPAERDAEPGQSTGRFNVRAIDRSAMWNEPESLTVVATRSEVAATVTSQGTWAQDPVSIVAS